ncbi:meiotic nuclear division protein 1 [Lipomyces oligophaga]|uniref:meiotic nuclear division protein 1 n=1 Tax=Lipomyces oligophaga TaxID=45792 RepID=UPI0034CFAC94
MSRKGVSAAEKNARLLAFFEESASFFGIKDIEKQGSKATGISSMVIKDVLQGLIDEGLIRCEKIGSGNYYWRFPSDVKRNQDRERKLIMDKVKELRQFEKSLDEIIQQSARSREDTAERRQLIESVRNKESELSALTEEIKSLNFIDPDLLLEKQAILATMKSAVNRWTDNIFAVIGYFRQMGTDMQLVYKEFDIPEDLDTV